VPNTKPKLPPIKNEQYDGQKFSVELIKKTCHHTFNWITAHEIRCTKCGVCYTGSPDKLESIYNHYNDK